MVHILSLVLLIVLLYFVSIIKYYVKTVMLQSQYSELATITVHRKYFMSPANILSLSQIFSLIRKYCLHLSHNLCHSPILTVSAKS